MKVAVVSFEDLADPQKNPSFCLSPLRALNDCHKCAIFQQHLKVWRQGKAWRLKCKPHIPKDIIDLLIKKEKILEQLAIINAALDTDSEPYEKWKSRTVKQMLEGD